MLLEPIELSKISAGVTYEGVVFVQDYQKKLDDSKRPLYGTLMQQGRIMKFKVWDKELQAYFNNTDLKGKILHVKAEAGTYNNVLELTLHTANDSHGVTDMSLFLRAVNVEGVFSDFAAFITANLSENGVSVISNIFNREQLYEKFKNSWAAMKMHDAQVGGLMNHTLKMLKLAKALFENDNRLAPYMDIIYIGIILHDIGKVEELNEVGGYTKDSFAGHRTIGVEYAVRNKDIFLAFFDISFYYHVLEIITGHHGKDYGDAPKTVWAYVVHLIDMLDSQVTGMVDRIDSGDVLDLNGNTGIYANGDKLVY